MVAPTLALSFEAHLLLLHPEPCCQAVHSQWQTAVRGQHTAAAWEVAGTHSHTLLLGAEGGVLGLVVVDIPGAELLAGEQTVAE